MRSIFLFFALLALPGYLVSQEESSSEMFTYDQEKVEASMTNLPGIETADKDSFSGGTWVGLATGLIGSVVSGCFIGALPGFIVGSGIGFGMTYALVVALRAATGM